MVPSSMVPSSVCSRGARLSRSPTPRGDGPPSEPPGSVRRTPFAHDSHRQLVRVADGPLLQGPARVDGPQVDAVFVADLDMISDFFFQERSLGNLNIRFDNVSFVLNAVDSLAGDESFIELRSRRAPHRTLEFFESKKRDLNAAASEAEKLADKEAEDEVTKRRQLLSKQVEEIDQNDNLDPIAKAQMLKQAQQAQQQRMSLAEAQIEQKKNKQLRKIRADTNRKVQAWQSYLRSLAILLPPIPAVVVGICVLLFRWSGEKKNIVAGRRR